MKHLQKVTLEVNGKTIEATITVDAPGLDTEDCLNAKMILAAVANGQNMTYNSRHHKDRSATVVVNPSARLDVAEPVAPRALRLVA